MPVHARGERDAGWARVGWPSRPVQDRAATPGAVRPALERLWRSTLGGKVAPCWRAGVGNRCRGCIRLQRLSAWVAWAARRLIAGTPAGGRGGGGGGFVWGG